MSDDSEPRNHECVRLISDKKVELRMENDEIYKVYGYNGKAYHHEEPSNEIIGEIVAPLREIVTIDKQNM